MSERVDLKHVQIDNLSLDEAVEQIFEASSDYNAKYVVTPNADHVLRLEKSHRFREIYAKADWILPDGFTVLLLAKRMGRRLKERVTGSDLMPALCKKISNTEQSVFILGGPPGAGDLAAHKLKEKYPSINICGVYSPKYGFEKDQFELSISIRFSTRSVQILFL